MKPLVRRLRILSPKGLAGVFATCFLIQSLHNMCAFLLFWHWTRLLLLLTQKPPLAELVEVQSPVPAGVIKGLQHNGDFLGELETRNPLGDG